MYSKNIFNLLNHISKEGKVRLDLEDEVVKGALITHNKALVNPRIKELLK